MLMRVAAVFMASMLLFSFHGKRAATLPLPVPRVLGGAFLYAVPAASSSLWIQGWLLLLCPTNPHPAGTKSVSPMPREEGLLSFFIFQHWLQRSLILTGPHPLVQGTEALTVCFEFRMSQNSRAACNEHDFYCSAFSFVHGKKSAAGFFS